MKHKQPEQSKEKQSGKGSEEDRAGGKGSQQQQSGKSPDQQSQPGIGSSQGQDRGSSDSNESQNIQRGDESSIVGASTGAFKERP